MGKAWIFTLAFNETISLRAQFYSIDFFNGMRKKRGPDCSDD